MLTPTGVTSAAYWEAIKSGMPTHVRITFLGQDIVLTDADIDISGGLQVTDILNGDTDLVFGKAICKQVSVTFLNSERLEGLLWTSEFKLEMGVEIGDPAETSWVTIGYFSGEKPQNVTTVRKIEFTAYDRMTLFDGLADDYVKSIEYPATLQDIYDGLCASVGIENEAGNELPDIMTRIFDVAPAEMEGYTCRDLLAWIAEACGCYAKVNAAGNVQMVWFTDNTSHEVSEDEEFNVETGDVNAGMIWNTADTFTWDEIGVMTWNDVTGYEEAFAIDEVMVKQLGNDLDINYPCPFGGNVYMIVENPFMAIGSATDINNFVVPIYNRLSVLGGYLPVNLHCVGNWCVEAGDVITIVVNGMEISFPIFVKTMTWNGAINDEYETTGNINREIYTSETNKRKVLENNKIELYVNYAVEEIEEDVANNYYKIRSGISISTNGITIDGSRFIKMNSGSEIDIESGGKINVKSGGDINVNSGGEINVKSGGNLNVASGGNIYINGTGMLSLTGSIVEIKSGSTFGVDSSNLVIDSNNGTFLTKSYTSAIQDYLAFCVGNQLSNYYNSNYIAQISPASSTFIRDDDTRITTYPVRLAIKDKVSQSGVEMSSELRIGQEYGYDVTDDQQKYLPIMKLSATKRENDNFQVINSHFIADIVRCKFSWASESKSQTGYIKDFTYRTIQQESSKDIKHNIVDLLPVGDRLDQLHPVTFIYDDDVNETQRMGMIYEDTIEVMPEICTQDESKKAINYVELIPALLKEIQDLRARVKELEER